MLVNDPRELEKIREREADITRERIQKIISAGECVGVRMLGGCGLDCTGWMMHQLLLSAVLQQTPAL